MVKQRKTLGNASHVFTSAVPLMTFFFLIWKEFFRQFSLCFHNYLSSLYWPLKLIFFEKAIFDQIDLDYSLTSLLTTAAFQKGFTF